MKFKFGFVLLFLVFGFTFTLVSSSYNGGYSCIGCIGIVTVVEQMSEFNNASIFSTFTRICDLFPVPVKPACETAIEYLGPFLIALIVNKNNPDVVCHALNFCYRDPGQPTCRVPGPSPNFSSKLPFDVQVAKAKSLLESLNVKKPFTRNICDLPGIRQICEWIKRPYSSRIPLVDRDGDGYSTLQGLRGSFWRGKDCSDISNSVHPGAKPLDHDKYFDSNCNGIYGINNVTNQPYEDELCSLTDQRGIAILGDSISAHFHLPPAWLDVTKMSAKAFQPLFTVLEDEFDWPMMSSATGHGSNSWKEVITGPIDSIYNRLFERNRCMHRDYQNLAVNGAESFSLHKFMKTLSRDPEKDNPLLLVIAMVGNDVCHGHRETLAGMTTAAQVYNNTMVTLRYLDTRLPKNSQIIIYGLADGRILYDAMHARIHPIGTFWKTITYSKFYDFMNCLDISPCPAWMNTNETIRNMAYKRVVELNSVLKEMAFTYRNDFKNFKVHFMTDPIKEAISEWERQGGETWQLIEPCDGFHTNQYGQALTSKVTWQMLEKNFPEYLGPINPQNDRIKKIFGDQGGF